MKNDTLSLEQQIREAVKELKHMFGNSSPEVKDPPPDATVESLWAELLEVRSELAVLKKTKRGVRPKVEDAVKLLVTNPKLAQIPIPLIAELICDVFSMYGVKSRCSENSVRWYLSQRGLDWDIVRRQMPPTRTEAANVDSELGEEGS